ncbi:MAG TPA: DinB family protein [Gemmatimonadaceae bacterium]|nr:DinB family protein [Gemmatimonadaceae bacterium]
MTKKEEWRAIVASSLDWEQAHTSLENALKGLPAELRAKKPTGFPHSVWDLLEHIRITQRDLLDFVQDKDYEEKLEWPKDYWPASAAPTSDREWNESIATWKRDRQALERFTTDTDLDLTTKIPRGTGQTYLRTILVAADHASYHLAQIVTVRQLLRAWPPAKGK